MDLGDITYSTTTTKQKAKRKIFLNEGRITTPLLKSVNTYRVVVACMISHQVE